MVPRIAPEVVSCAFWVALDIAALVGVVRRRGCFTVNADGGGAVRLTDHGGDTAFPPLRLTAAEADAYRKVLAYLVAPETVPLADDDAPRYAD